MQQFTYYRPEMKEEVFKILSDCDGRILAGGTDIIPRIRKGFQFEANMVDISRVKEFDFIDTSGAQVCIGSLVTYNKIVTSRELQEAAPILISAAAVVGSYQTRQRGTIGGNIGNASPAGDILPPLLVLDADVVVESQVGKRRMPLRDFITGPGRTALQKGEVISMVCFSKPAQDMKYFFYKKGKRNAMACSVVNVAMAASFTDERVKDIRIAFGSVAPKPLRCNTTEELLKDHVLNDALIDRASLLALDDISPISDVRASAETRKIFVRQLLKRGLQCVAGMEKL